MKTATVVYIYNNEPWSEWWNEKTEIVSIFG